ncbi:TOR signaling pathway regulator (TapA) [Rasamsonia emersonii CBS 393.64]|uniref:TOR signaling pathway regulator (TapA) n=1 Tax=Rasamsonia emersonii (strain ATCC 16479 / CBS 393.64 / IMI 116815) TaxID=1408163 RepID=A0A0F4YTP5_RASE3|nr:TOR signaling pathway regulator (TapA) [Rasamsonia emersonii CBS 393.64]KKA21485.1 TOR signaling pathway regulator (TapA) [Rasamsonia emersonii CBS 393.64]
MAERPQNLQALFAAAKERKRELESSLETNSDSYRDKVNETIAQFEECQKLIRELSLFSSNEGVEDIATADLQYDCTAKDLVQRSSGPDREAVLRRALTQYEKYLMRLDEYDLLSPDNKKLHERYLENPSAFTLASMNDAAARRQVKVARFREEKELKQKLENDDDTTRQLYLAEINLYTHQTFQALDLISQELSMLSQMRNAPPQPENTGQDDPRKQDNRDKTGYSERLDPPVSQLLKGGKLGPLLSKDGKPLQPFTLTDRRTQLREGVFRPGHNLPTMTIEEYLEEERKRGGIIQGGNQNEVREIDEDDMEKADEETMKARAWDEFKEENPRGSGNTLNRG